MTRVLTLACLIVLMPAAATGQPSKRAPAAAPGRVVEISGHDYVFLMPTSVPAGLITFRFHNAGKVAHVAVLTRLPAGRTANEFYTELFRTNQIPTWAERYGGLNTTEAGETTVVTQRLTPGTYVWVCMLFAPDRKLHFAKGMVRAMTVTATTAARVPDPTVDVTIRLSDHAFTLSHPLRSGFQRIGVENTAKQAHELLLLKLEPGATLEDVKAWHRSPIGPRAYRAVGGVGWIMGGARAFLDVELSPGTYVLYCRAREPESGQPHWELGMAMPIEVRD